MYKSPIDIIYGQLETQIEGDVMRAVQKIAVNVDKDELILALQYDRGQYKKGYLDAQAEILRCKDCEYTCPGTSGLICTMWGAGTDPDGWCYKGERREGE
jgi:hypothetical protein